jgi:pimeloyl-ACP methyl ester carboxylesterase
MAGLRSVAPPGRLRWDDVRLMRAAPAAADGWLSGWADIDGIRTHHRHRAAPAPGPVPVVLVHGLAVSHRYLMPTAHALAGRVPVLVPDLPGFGLSGKPRRVFDVAAHARHLQRWLDHLGLGPVCLLGHSFGAEVAARLARTRPDLAAAVVLAGPTADPAARSRRGQTARWVRDLAAEDVRQAAVLLRDIRDAGVGRILRTLGHSVRNRIEDDVAALRVPVLAIGGERDPVAPAAWRARLAADRVTVPGAAHNVATTAGPEVADAIAAFLIGR